MVVKIPGPRIRRWIAGVMYLDRFEKLHLTDQGVATTVSAITTRAMKF